ncbi:tetratricopeptide repeat protein [Sorangium sp. So ce216]
MLQLRTATMLAAEAGRLHRGGEYREALDKISSAMTIWEHVRGANDASFAAFLNEGALLWAGLGDHERAERAFERALALREELQGREHPDVADTLHGVASLAREKAEFARSEALCRRALDIREKTLGAWHPAVAESLTLLAALGYEKGDYEAALRVAERALAIHSRSSRDQEPSAAVTLDVLGALHRARGDDVLAERFYLRALEAREEKLRPDHPDVAHSLCGLAALYRERGDSAQAEPLLTRAIAVREEALGLEHPAVAIALSLLADLYHGRSDFARAEPLYRRALGIQERALGPAHPAVAASLNQLASFYHDQSDYPRAEPLYRRALELREAVLGPWHPQVAESLNHLAVMWRDRGDLGRAERLLARALTVRERALGSWHPDIASTVDDIAELRMEQGDHPGAIDFYNRSFAIRSRTMSDEHPDIATSLTNLARFHVDTGDPGRAEPLLERARAVREKVLGPEHPDVAATLRLLAEVHSARGDHARAAPLYERAVAIQTAALGPWHPAVVPLLYDLSSTRLARGDTASALEAQARGVAVRDRHAALLLAAGAEAQKRAYMNVVTRETSRTISFHIDHAPLSQDAARLALTAVLQRKARVLDAMAGGIALLRSRLQSEDRRVLDSLAAVQSELATLTLRGPGPTALDRHSAALLRLEERREALEGEVSKRSAEFQLQSSPVTLERVQAAIPGGAALVEIIAYEPFDIKAVAPRSPWGTPRYAAYVTDRGGAVKFVDLGEAGPIHAAVRDFRRALVRPGVDPRPAARELDARIMQPVRLLLGSVREILLSPDGTMNLIPFGALVDEKDAYLIESSSFTYLTSGRDLLRGRAATSTGAPTVVAAPDFGDLTGQSPQRGGAWRRSVDMTAMRFPPLPSTAVEASHVARLVGGAHVLLRGAATEEAIKSVRRPRVLHLATHGFFLPEDSGQRSSSGERWLSGELSRRAPLAAENPLLRSGLVLAGVNQRSSGTDDGVLTALEVAGLDLHGTRLVVLSACETGVGAVSNGEGVYGLRRALVLAGAETQVMSLWKIDDGATLDLMKAYYGALRAGLGRSEALHDVQRSMLRTRAHPYYWAGFIVSGDGSPLQTERFAQTVEAAPCGWRGCACATSGCGARPTYAWLMPALACVVLARRARRDHALRLTTLAVWCAVVLAGCARYIPSPEVTLIRTEALGPSYHGDVQVSATQVPTEATQLGVIWVHIWGFQMSSSSLELMRRAAAGSGGDYIKLDHISTQCGEEEIVLRPGRKYPLLKPFFTVKVQLCSNQILGRVYRTHRVR